MSRDPLDQRLQDYYESQDLGPAKLAELREEAAKSVAPDPRPLERESTGRSARVNRRGWLAAALVVFSASLVTLVIWQGSKSGEQGADVVRDAAKEIARNHHKRLDVEHRTEVYADLVAGMPRLDFSPIEPRRVHERGLRLLGARYCSIDGSIAAQMRLLDGEDRLLTLYQFRPTAAFEGLREHIEQIDGLEVEVWSEAGLICGLARPVD